ncbi:MAG: Mov34/MPN/PAD-1 family protein [Pseudomonadota bacterium]
MSLIWRKTGSAQRIRITDAVLNHVAKHQQNGVTATEAGGQLFGTVSRNEVRLVVAVGPHLRDERGRTHYRSDRKAAQRAIRDQAKRGLLFLGEWHTHPQDVPAPSGDDRDAIALMVGKSSLNVDAAVLLIVGRENPPLGLYIGTYREGVLETWHCGTARIRRFGTFRRWISKFLL